VLLVVLDSEAVEASGLCCGSVKSLEVSLLLLLDTDAASKNKNSPINKFVFRKTKQTRIIIH
jgi:hypothetical protein